MTHNFRPGIKLIFSRLLFSRPHITNGEKNLDECGSFCGSRSTIERPRPS